MAREVSFAVDSMRQIPEPECAFVSSAAADEVGNENEKRTFRERFQQVRPQVLQILR